MEKEILEKKLEEINQVIKLQYQENSHIGVLSGLSGIALFQFYYSKYLNDNSYSKTGKEILEECMKRINNGYHLSTYCSGIAGFGWVITHLCQENFLEIDSEELLIELDNHFYEMMIFDMKNGKYDFLHGGIGYAYYFLKRYENIKSQKLKLRYENILLEFIDLLEVLSEKGNENSSKWLSVIPKDELNNIDKREVYNLNLSHGMSSIVGILTKLHKFDTFKIPTKKMLEGAVNYILSFKNQNENAFSLFPSWVSITGEIIDQSRLGWCYGDLSIGVRIWYASKVLKNNNFKNKSLTIMEHAAKRMSPEKSLVVDAGICHGSFGNAQTFLRIFNETHSLVFKKAADYWIQDGIEKAIYQDGYAGYKQHGGINADRPFASTTLLEGIAGIGLTIIDYLANFDTNWDECLMIN